MKAIILSAGQGSRLLPWTENTPKCLLPIYGDVTTLSWQLTELQKAGVTEAVIVTGFHAEKVERELAKHSMKTRTVFNPFFQVADNLASVWMAREELTGDCVLINGDTLFTADVPRALQAQAKHNITVTVSRKDRYDDDDMKVIESNGVLKKIGKKLQGPEINAESIGFIRFKAEGARLFRAAVERSMYDQQTLGKFYLSIIGELAEMTGVGIADVADDLWCETDFPDDLIEAKEMAASWAKAMSGAKLKEAV